MRLSTVEIAAAVGGVHEGRSRPVDDYRFALRLSERGEVVGIGDGIAWIRGLPSVRLDELTARQAAGGAAS